ncbi:MAG: flagellar basal body rod protein FlgC, partial [Planctomycetaceae bacterium]
MFRSLDLSTSGLLAQRERMNTIAGNIANIDTTRDADGNASPFQRRMAIFSSEYQPPGSDRRGVGVDYKIEIDKQQPPRLVYEPGHPDANAEGYVSYPDINVVSEFTNAIEASRAYEANVVAIELSKQMSQTSLRILA